MKVTFGDIKGTAAKVLNMNSSDPRVLAYVNRACERLLYDAGKSVDTLVRYTVCVTDGCITWPREIETIEAWATCKLPGMVRNQWYEFLGYGPGQMSSTDGSGRQLIDRGNAVAFDDVIGTNKRLAVWADAVEATGLKLLVRYYDSNANKVYSIIDGSWDEGQQITIAPGTYAYSSSLVMAGGLYEVIKPVTKKPIRLYEYDVSANTYRALAMYEPDETLPTYRRSLIPCLASTTEGCSTTKVTVLAKRRLIPAVNDNSVLIISNQDAIRLGCQALKKEEDVGIADAEPLWKMAIRCLDRQMRHWTGDGVSSPINFAGADRPVCNIL